MHVADETKVVIGLVGGVGAGKSAVAAEFASLGCRVIDGDAIGYELLDGPDVQERIGQQWGPGVFDSQGAVDRRKLGEIVFDDPGQLEALNRIMQPHIGGRIEAAIVDARQDPTIPAVIVDAAILFEAGWDRMCTHAVFIEANREIRQRRAAERGWSNEEWRKREKSQFSLDTKRRRCYCTIDNSSSVSHLREQVHRLFYQLVPSAGHS